MLRERKRALARRIGFSERSDVRAAVQRPRRRPTVWLGIPVGLPIAADFLIFVSVPRSPLIPGHGMSVAALGAWRSPTVSLLVSHTTVLRTPFTLRGIRMGFEPSRS